MDIRFEANLTTVGNSGKNQMEAAEEIKQIVP